MRFVSTRAHGVADYVVGVLLIVAPWLFGFSGQGAAMWVPLLLGIGVIAYSLLTEYEYGIADVIPMPTHLWLDGLGGAVLLISPWLFGFSNSVWVPHVVIGLLEIGAALMTETRPQGVRRTV